MRELWKIPRLLKLMKVNSILLKKSKRDSSFKTIMYRTGSVNLPLHSGKAPRWLFARMIKLSSEHAP